MPDFTDEFVRSFVPSYQQGVETGVSYAERMMMLDYRKSLDAERQAMDDERFQMDKTLYDFKIQGLERQRDIETQKSNLATSILETESRIEKIESAKPIEGAVKRVGIKDRAGKKLPITSNKKAMQVLNLKKEQMQDELGVLIDPMRAVPEQIGAKTQAEIGLIKKRTGDVGEPKPRTKAQIDTEKRTLYNFAKSWLSSVAGIDKSNLQGLSMKQYNRWLKSVEDQFKAGVDPVDIKLPQITEKAPLKKSRFGLDVLAKDEPRADTTFFPFAGGGEAQALTPQEQEIVQSFKNNPNLTPNWNLIKADYPDVDIERMKIAIQSR